MNTLQLLADHASDICQIATCGALLIKPIRERILGTKDIREGQLCLLRSDIMKIYRDHKESKRLSEYEYRHLEFCYKAYKALGGNSFIDHIYAEMQGWDTNV
jgi:hypothetical protein